jgi:hypothetical protein
MYVCMYVYVFMYSCMYLDAHIFMICMYRYEQEGKYFKKINTFTDFCDAAEYLIKQVRLVS